MHGCECSNSTDTSPWEETECFTQFFAVEHDWSVKEYRMVCTIPLWLEWGLVISDMQHAFNIWFNTCCNTLHKKLWYWATGKCSLHWRFLKHTDFVFSSIQFFHHNLLLFRLKLFCRFCYVELLLERQVL